MTKENLLDIKFYEPKADFRMKDMTVTIDFNKGKVVANMATIDYCDNNFTELPKVVKVIDGKQTFNRELRFAVSFSHKVNGRPLICLNPSNNVPHLTFKRNNSSAAFGNKDLTGTFKKEMKYLEEVEKIKLILNPYTTVNGMVLFTFKEM